MKVQMNNDGDILLHYGVKGMKWGKTKKHPDSQLADDVIRGKYGNGEARKKALGKNYKRIQSIVNQKLKGTYKEPTVPDQPQDVKEKESSKQKTKEPQTLMDDVVKSVRATRDDSKGFTVADARVAAHYQSAIQELIAGKGGKTDKEMKAFLEKNYADDQMILEVYDPDEMIKLAKKYKNIKHHDEDTLLLHYGVLGMKWGVRKSRPTKSQRLKKKADRIRAREKKSKGKIGANPISRKHNIELRNNEIRSLDRRIRSTRNKQQRAKLRQQKADLENLNVIAANRSRNEKRIKWALGATVGTALAVPGVRDAVKRQVLKKISRG